MGKSSQGKHKRQFPVFKQSVLDWYTEQRWNEVYSYLIGERFSRRFIEHFITEYSRTHTCEYPLADEFTGDVFSFNVYHSAQTVLSGVHKRHMDPFGRKNKNAENNGRFIYGFGEKRCEVSVCELIFFRWAYQNKVMEYVAEHEEEIKADMSRMAKEKRETVQKLKNMLSDAEEVIVEMPMPLTTTSNIQERNPFHDKYWKGAIDEKMQQPKRKRKRYRESSVDMLMNNDIEIKAAL